MTRLVLSAAAVLVGAITLRGADWPQWRGPDRTGISKETGLLKTWPKDGPPKVWTVAGCGGGFSSIVVADGVIYGTGSVRGKNVAWAQKESDGKPIWSQPYADGGSEPEQHAGRRGREDLRPHHKRANSPVSTPSPASRSGRRVTPAISAAA